MPIAVDSQEESGQQQYISSSVTLKPQLILVLNCMLNSVSIQDMGEYTLNEQHIA